MQTTTSISYYCSKTNTDNEFGTVDEVHTHITNVSGDAQEANQTFNDWHDAVGSAGDTELLEDIAAYKNLNSL